MFCGCSPTLCLSVHQFRASKLTLHYKAHLTFAPGYITKRWLSLFSFFFFGYRFLGMQFAFYHSHTEMHTAPSNIVVSFIDGCCCLDCTEAVFVHTLHRVTCFFVQCSLWMFACQTCSMSHLSLFWGITVITKCHEKVLCYHIIYKKYIL